MDDAALDALLRQAPDDPLPPEVAELDVEVLRALRAGRLDEAAAAAVDARLASDPAARRALQTLGEPVPAPLAAWARQHGPPPASRRWIAPAVGGALALAAALVVFLLQSGAPPAPAYRLGEIRGAAQTVRGEPSEQRVFLPRSRITLTVLPEGEPAEATPHLKLFVSSGGGPLRAGARVKVQAKDRAFRVQAEAGTLFGSAAGPRVIWIGVSADAERLAAAAGRPPADARALGGVRWIEIPVDYRLTGP